MWPAAWVCGLCGPGLRIFGAPPVGRAVVAPKGSELVSVGKLLTRETAEYHKHTEGNGVSAIQNCTEKSISSFPSVTTSSLLSHESLKHKVTFTFLTEWSQVVTQGHHAASAEHIYNPWSINPRSLHPLPVPPLAFAVRSTAQPGPLGKGLRRGRLCGEGTPGPAFDPDI